MSPFDTLKTATAVLSVLLIGAFAMGVSTADAQDETTVTIEGQEADPGQATNVPVEATNFDGVGALKFEIDYDPAVLSFPDGAGTDDIISGAPDGFDAELLEEGTIEIEYVDLSGTNPLNFGDGVLFDLTFSAFEGGRSDLSFTENSRVTDQSGDDIAVTFGDGFVSEGVGTVSLGTEEGVVLNEAARIPLSGEDLSNVGSFTLEVAFDESVADFEGIVNDESGLDLKAGASNGVITIEGLNQNGVTLGQNFAELEFSFLGQDTDLRVRSENSEVSDASLNLLDVTYEDGVLSGDSPALSVPDVGITPGTQIEVPVEASELRDIGSASVAISFNESVLTFDGARNQIGQDQSNTNFSADTPEPGVVQIEGISENGVDPANNDGKLLDLLFTAEEGVLNDGDSVPLTFAEGNEITNNDSPSDLYNTSFEGGNLVVESPAISFSRTSVDYGSVQTGDAATETVAITNQATEAATLEGDVSLAGGSDAAYSVTNGSGAYSLGPGESQDVTIEYAPTEVSNPDEGVLQVTSNDPENGSQDISLTGQAEPVQVALPAQSLDQREGDTELRVEDVIANAGDAVLVTTDNGDGDFTDETVVGSTTLEEDVDGGEVLVDVGDADPVDHAAHVSTDGTVGGVVATSDRAPVYATAQFDFSDETAVGETGTVTVDAVEILYEGEVGANQIAINLHEADQESGRVGAFVGISQEDLAVNEVHEDVAVDVVEPVSPDEENPERIEDTIGETGDFFAMAHRGAAGTDADGERIPAQNPPLATTAGPGVIGDFATVTVERERGVALNPQSLDLTAGDTELRVEDVIANAGDAVLVTTDNGDGDFTDETVVGSTTLEEDVDGGEVLVDVGDADPVDHAAHVSTDGTVGGVVATSDRAPVYATAQFDFSDETAVGETGTVTVDAVEILYEGEVGANQIAINLHEADQESGRVGAFVGISQEDLAVNEVHEDVAVDVVEPVSPDEENPERIEDTIGETGDFFAMAHRGAAGTDADGERIPAQNPPLATTAGPGVIGDFATVTVERERGVALNPQSLDLTAGDTELRVEDVIANAGDAVLVTTDNGDGDFTDETVVGSTTLEEDVDGGEVLVDVGDADPVDHAAHVSTDGTVGGVVATSDRAPVYATAQFDFSDETAVGETGTVTVDAVEILYEGEVGANQIAINLHEADQESGRVGAFVGISQEDLAVNEVHEDVAVDVVEPVSPDEENPERIEDTIGETGDFFAMAHRGAAGTDADGERIPAQNPPLATTAGPGVIGDFATVTVERERGVALNPQSLDLTAGDTELRVEDVIANAGDAVLVTTDNGDGDFTDETVVGSTTLEEDVDGGEVLVDVGDADPVDHAAHVSTDGTVGGVVATSDRAPVYATAQFDFSDETAVGETGTVTVDAVEILYEGEVGANQIAINLHEADQESGRVGAFVGISQEDLAVNEVHEDVAVDVVEPVSPDEENPERIEDTIGETGDFFAMAHRGAAGTDADGERIPAQNPPLATTAGPGVIGDFATVTVERERGVALNPQSLDLTAGDTELRVEDVIANAGDAVLVTTDNGDGDFTDETVVGSTTLEEDVDGGEVLVDVGDADPVDHAAHVSTDGTVGGVVATSDRAPVYATAQFDFSDETAVGETGTVTVDAVEILYEGEVGANQIAINLHEADQESGRVGAFVGISQEDLAVNEVHEDVAVDVVEPVSPDEENPERIEDTIGETGDFFAMAHRGAAGTDADGERIPAQNPPLATTAGPGVIGDFATVTVEAADLTVNVSRDFEGGASDPGDYELVAIPGSTGVDVAETVTGDRGTNWRAFLETGGSGGDGSLQSYGDEPFSFRAGRGVWVLAQNGWSFEGTVPAVSAADGTPSVPLQDGWNAISNPLQEDLVWANVRDASGLSEALFRWTGDGGFQPVDTLRSARENGEAYYTLNNEGADDLELTSGAGSNSTLAANTAAKGRSNASPRTVELSATAGGKGMTSTVTVGMNPSAKEASSYRAPPAHFGGTALRIRDGDPVKSFMRMVAATDAKTSRFDLSLQAEPGTSVEISAGDLPESASPNFGVVLVDGGDTYDLRDGPATVTVSENSGSAGFQVRLGDAEKIAQQTAPDETRLKANYPNPFSEQTTIEYDVAEQSEVNIRVYNVLGQQVATLARGTKQAGTHQVDWSGQSLSSGKYFVRLEAGGTTDTKQITIVR